MKGCIAGGVGTFKLSTFAVLSTMVPVLFSWMTTGFKTGVVLVFGVAVSPRAPSLGKRSRR